MNDQDNVASGKAQELSIGVCVHVEPTTTMTVDFTQDAPTLGFKGYGYPSATLFFSSREKLAELRDTISGVLAPVQTGPLPGERLKSFDGLLPGDILRFSTGTEVVFKGVEMWGQKPECGVVFSNGDTGIVAPVNLIFARRPGVSS